MAYFSQFEEDKLIEKYIKDNNLNINKTIVEIGCAYPEFLSNSKTFIDQGYKAILIDANTKFFDLQSHYHSNNPNVEVINCAITNYNGKIKFDEKHEATHGGISEDGIEKDAKTLKSVLDESKNGISEIGILSIDVEGHDDIVLKSIFEDQIFPEFIIIEANNKAEREKQVKILQDKYVCVIETAHGLFNRKTVQFIDFLYHRITKKHFLLSVNTIWLRKDKVN